MRLAIHCFILLMSAGFCGGAHAETFFERAAASSVWCEDTLSFCWSRESRAFPGLRVLSDLSPSLLLDVGATGNVEGGDFAGMALVGIEAPIYTPLVAVQLFALGPFRAKFSPESNALLADPASREVGVRFGFAGGLYVLRLLSISLGFLAYDNEAFRGNVKGIIGDPFVMVHVEPISILRDVSVASGSGSKNE